MALKNFLRSRLGGVLAASALFVTATPEVQAAKKSPTANQQTQEKQKATYSEKNIKQLKEKLDKLVLNSLKPKLVKWEKNIAHLYFDSEGNLTTGIGLNVDDWKSFRMLEFKDKKGNAFTEQQKLFYYNQIKKYKSTFSASKGFKGFDKYPATYYNVKFGYSPTQASKDALFTLRIQGAMRDVKKTLGEQAFYNLHPEAQSELLQMYFRLGYGKFKNFGNLIKAAKKLDYTEMAKESHIQGPQKDKKGNITDFERRNIATYNAFIACKGYEWKKYGDIIARGQQKQLILTQKKATTLKK